VPVETLSLVNDDWNAHRRDVSAVGAHVDLIGLPRGDARDPLNLSRLGVHDKHATVRAAGDESAAVRTRDERVQWLVCGEDCGRLRATLNGLQQRRA